MTNAWKRLTRTRTRVHGEHSEQAQRLDAERDCERAGLRLLLAVLTSVTGLASVLPQAGRDGWWLALGCMVPGLALALLARLMMGRTGAPTAEELMRRVLGRFGSGAWRAWRCAALLLAGETALCCLSLLFSEGVETGADPRWIAVLTLSCALLCGGLRGLNRAVWLLRGLLGVTVLGLAAELVGLGRADRLLPMGQTADALQVLARMNGLAWPSLLVLSLPPRARRAPGLGPVPPLLLTGTLLLLACAALPHALLRETPTVADALLLPAAFLSPVGREAAMVLWAAALLLCVGLSLWGAAEMAPAHPGRMALLAALALLLPALLGLKATWTVLVRAQTWVLAPPAALLLAGIPGAIKHGRGKGA